jgi:hypothetical protein
MIGAYMITDESGHSGRQLRDTRQGAVALVE